MLETLGRSGLEARLVPTPGQPMVYGQRPVDRRRPRVLIYGHYDVQPVDPLDAWQTPPFEPVVRDGRLYGAWLQRQQGPDLAQLLGLRALLALDGELPLNVKVILEGEEANGSPHLAGLVEQHRAAVLVRYVERGSARSGSRAPLHVNCRCACGADLRALVRAVPVT